ncbi:hypothetical protein OIU78_015544 [Salix suchowensis]|nr:hypothetical protein OIU78_015544 [Salix suchowensis]
MDGFDHRIAPSFFICPISLQIMKDPVTISTGMTFDRESIQKWLFSYKNISCPITKQPLSDFRLTPNSNLLRLIQSWHLQHASSSSSSSTKFAEPNHDALMKVLLEEIKQPHLQVNALRKIKSLIQENDGDNNKISCIRDDTLFSLAASLVVQTELPGIPQITGNDTPVIAEAVSLLCLLRPSDEALKMVSQNENGRLICSLCSIMTQYLSYLQIRIQAALVLKSIFEVVDGVYKEGLKFEFFENIIEILKDQNSKHGSVAVLSILIRVLKYGNNKEKSIKGGVIPILIELLAEDNDQGHVCEMMLVVLEKLCQKAEGRAAFLTHPAGMAAVLSKILKVSHVGDDKSISLLSCVLRFCTSSGEAAQEFMEVGGVTKICSVIQSGCHSKTKEKAREVFRVSSQNMEQISLFPLS